MLKQMKETNNKSIANAVGAGLVSAQKEKTINKSIANAVGVAPQGDPQTKNIKGKPIANVVGADSISTHKKTTNNNLTANIVGADDPVCPSFEEPTRNKRSPKDNSNLISNFQPLTSDHRGITLIALVITIIIMLILVTVTITVALKGELFNTAKQAKTETENKINEEQNLASGKVEIDGKWYDSIDEYVKGGVVPTESDYGKYVKYGVDLNGDENYENDWKVFYVDGEGRTFIIAADYVNGDKCNALQTAAETNSKMTHNTGEYEYCYYWDKTDVTGDEPKVTYHCNDGHNKDLNKDKAQCSYPDIFMATGYYCSDHVGEDGTGGNPSSRCASTLLCTENWKPFVDASYGATYAIGGPTLEMWVASWNKRHGKDAEREDNGITLCANGNNNEDRYTGYNIGTDEEPSEYIYYLAGCDGYDDTLYFPHQSDYNDLDNDGSDEICYGYWLASPFNYYGNGNLTVVRNNSNLGYGQYYSYDFNEKRGLRPLVCLESGVKLAKTVES